MSGSEKAEPFSAGVRLMFVAAFAGEILLGVDGLSVAMVVKEVSME